MTKNEMERDENEVEAKETHKNNDAVGEVRGDWAC